MIIFHTLFAHLWPVNTNKLIIIALKALIAFASVFFIYLKVISRPDFPEMVEHLRQTISLPDNFKLIIFLFLLMMVNWLLETAKWKILLHRIEPSGWLKCFRSVMSGVTVSIFTPNRIGEFAGRVLHLHSGHRIKASIASVIGSMNQLLITLVAGGVGLIFSLSGYLPGEPILVNTLNVLITVAMVALVFIYFRIPKLSILAEKFPALRNFALYTRVFGLYSFSRLLKITGLSMIRYLIFSFQFILLLHLFGINLSYFECFRLITLIYLVMAVVPSIALSELTIRGSVTLYFLSPIAGNSVGILSASSMLWMLNLVIPAVFGALAAFYFRINK